MAAKSKAPYNSDYSNNVKKGIEKPKKAKSGKTKEEDPEKNPQP